MSAGFYFLSILILLAVCSNTFAQKDVPKAVSDEILNAKAISLPDPVYPAAARAVRAGGAVHVQVTIDENGDVINAQAISGHPLLRATAVQAARQAKFVPTTVDGKTVKVTGTIVYLFVMPGQWKFIGETLGDAEMEIGETRSLMDTAEILANVYPDISKSIKTVVENFRNDEQAARFQTNAIGDIAGQLKTRLANEPKNLWHFELGLTVGKIKANYFDDAVLRAGLPKIRELADTYPDKDKQNPESLLNNEQLENMMMLGDIGDKIYFSRKDKTRVRSLIYSL